MKNSKINPKYYATKDGELWELMIDVYGKDKFMAFCELNAFKYSYRAGNKPGNSKEQDLKKMDWYINKLNKLLAK